jgi:hypothetical protein
VLETEHVSFSVEEAGSAIRDESIVCQEGYQKKQEMRQESQEGMEAKADSAQVDLFSRLRQ